MAHWSLSDMPRLDGQRFVVTGANGGVGFETTAALAEEGASVVMACRDVQKGEHARAQVLERSPNARLEVRPLDVSVLASVQAFAEGLVAQGTPLDGLIANAGVMAAPRTTTVDGFELQMGTNHLGHFALVLRLLPLLERAVRPRVVVVSSTAHKWGPLDLDDLMSERAYSPWRAYGRSKLANLLFVQALSTRLTEAGAKTVVVAAHPGYAATNILVTGPKPSQSKWAARFFALTSRYLAQSAAQGALPLLYAATSPDVKRAAFYGPHGPFEMWGAPVEVQPTAQARDLTTAQRLFELSERLTGVTLSLDGRPGAQRARPAHSESAQTGK